MAGGPERPGIGLIADTGNYAYLCAQMVVINDIRQQQAILLDILKHLDSFCRENGITYALAGGSMLGAVRHKGFIPWDDDADIIMPRPDFDRFQKIYRNEGRYRLLSSIPDNGRCFKNCYYKFEDSYTLCEDVGYIGRPFGMNVDIFPLDGAPDSAEEQRSMAKKITHYKHRISLRPKPLWSIFKPHQGAPLALIQAHLFSLDHWLNKCDRVLRSHDFETSNYSGALCGLYGTREIFPTRIFKELTEYEFEDTRLMGVKDYDTYLKGLYGNYMQLPPEKDRHGEHHLKVTLTMPEQL